MLDECHKAKNLFPSKSGKSSKTGSAVVELQERLPKARVVYCSATGVWVWVRACVRVCVYDCIVSYVCDVCVGVGVFESMVNVTNVSMQVLLNRATWDTWHGWASGAKEHSFLVFWTSLRLWKEGT